MPAIVCERCGAEIPPGARSCPACGTSRTRRASPQVWAPPGGRRVAFVIGVLIALLILAMLVWRVADSRRRPLDPAGPVVPVGAVAPVKDHPSPVLGEGWPATPG